MSTNIGIEVVEAIRSAASGGGIRTTTSSRRSVGREWLKSGVAVADRLQKNGAESWVGAKKSNRRPKEWWTGKRKGSSVGDCQGWSGLGCW